MMKQFLVFILLFPTILTAQEKYFHELKGMEDSTGTTHLFYRLFDSETDFECCIIWTDNVFHFNTFTMEDSVLFESIRQIPIFSPSTRHDNFIDDYLFLDNDPVNSYWISNSKGDWSNQFSYVRGSNNSYFYSGHHWGNRIAHGTNDTLSFVAKNYESSSSIVVLENNSLPSEPYEYPVLVKANPEEPLCFENGDCFYGASDSVRFLNYNFLDVNPYQPNNIYLTRNDSLFITSDLGTEILFLNDQFDWSTIGSISFSSDSSAMIATTEHRFRIHGEFSTYTNYQLLQSLNGGQSWVELHSDTSRIYVSDLYSFGADDFYMGAGKELYLWNQLANEFSEVYTFESQITGIYKTSGYSTIYVLTKEELFVSQNGGSSFISLKKLPSANENFEGIPSKVLLYQNYPNPFNPNTTIGYELNQPMDVKLTVFDALGRTVSILVDERKTTGLHEINVDASTLSSGIYFYRLEAGEFSQIKRFTLIK